MTAIIFHGLERLALVAGSIFIAYLGYKLFIQGITSKKKSTFKAKSAWFTVVFSGQAPGLFFMLAAVSVMVVSLMTASLKINTYIRDGNDVERSSVAVNKSANKSKKKSFNFSTPLKPMIKDLDLSQENNIIDDPPISEDPSISEDPTAVLYPIKTVLPKLATTSKKREIFTEVTICSKSITDPIPPLPSIKLKKLDIPLIVKFHKINRPAIKSAHPKKKLPKKIIKFTPLVKKLKKDTQK